MIQNIINDIRTDAIPYVPVSIFVGVVAGFVCAVFLYTRHKEKIAVKSVMVAVGIFYLTLLVNIVLLSRLAGSRDAVDMTLFGTWGADATAHAYVIENVLLFIPIGILIPTITSKLNKWYYTILIACLLSICIEWIQYFTKRGYTQLDDVVMNTIGAGAGYMIYAAAHYFKHRKDEITNS